MGSARTTVWVVEPTGRDASICREALETIYDLLFFEDVQSALVAIASGARRPVLAIGESTVVALGVPFLILSERHDLESIRASFRDGALDYVSKPARHGEILVKVERAVTVLASRNPNRPGSAQDLVFYPSRLEIVSARLGVTKRLTLKEAQILEAIRAQPDLRQTRERLFRQIWPDTKVGGKTLDIHIHNLRKKLRAFGLAIRFLPPNTFALMEEAPPVETPVPIQTPETAPERGVS